MPDKHNKLHPIRVVDRSHSDHNCVSFGHLNTVCITHSKSRDLSCFSFEDYLL